MKYEIGMILETRVSGDIEILDINKKIFKIKFLEDGTIADVVASSISNRSVKNYNRKSIFGIGVIGYGKNKCCINKKITKEYRLWTDLLRRCYAESHLKKHRSKCYFGCIVDERWHNFQNFCEDLPKLKNYDKWIEEAFRYYSKRYSTIVNVKDISNIKDDCLCFFGFICNVWVELFSF